MKDMICSIFHFGPARYVLSILILLLFNTECSHLLIHTQEGIIMDGFFPFSEETTRGPTPPDPSMTGGPSGRGGNAGAGGGQNGPQNGGHHHHHHHGAGGVGDVGGGLKIKVPKGGPSSGPVAFSGDHGAGTPSASLVGNRAKMRRAGEARGNSS